MIEEKLENKKEKSELVKNLIVGGAGLVLCAGLEYLKRETGVNEPGYLLQAVVAGFTIGGLITPINGGECHYQYYY